MDILGKSPISSVDPEGASPGELAADTANGQESESNQGRPPADPVTDPVTGKGRDRRGRFASGNIGHLKHGRYSRAVAQALLPEQHAMLQELQAHEAAILTDLGGVSGLSTFELDLVSRYEQLGRIADFNAARMLAPRVAVRNQAHSAFMSAIDRQLKILVLLGTKRREKDIGAMSVREHFATLQEDENDEQKPT